ADLVDIDAADELASVDLDATAGDDLFDSRVLPGQLLDHHAHAVRGQVERPGEPRHDLQRGGGGEAVDVTVLEDDLVTGKLIRILPVVDDDGHLADAQVPELPLLQLRERDGHGRREVAGEARDVDPRGGIGKEVETDRLAAVTVALVLGAR